MTVLEVLGAIFSEFLLLEAVPYALAALALTSLGWFWRRSSHSPKQRRAIQLALSLWLFGPIAAVIGALFHFTGPSASRGVTFNEPAALAVQALLLLCAALGVALAAYARGARANIAAVVLPVLFMQFWISLVSGCAIAGVCI